MDAHDTGALSSGKYLLAMWRRAADSLLSPLKGHVPAHHDNPASGSQGQQEKKNFNEKYIAYISLEKILYGDNAREI